MLRTRLDDLEERLQELEQYAVRQIPATVEPRFAFKLPQPVDSDHGVNDSYLRKICAQETGRVPLRGADKKTLYDIACRGELLSRFPCPISDGPFVIEKGIFVQEVQEDNWYKEDAARLYDALTGKAIHTLPFGAAYPCKTRHSYLFQNTKRDRIMDLMGCSEISCSSSKSQWGSPYIDISCFSSEHVERLIENRAWSVFDAATGHLVFGRANYMFSLNDYRESNIQFFVKGKVVQLFGKGENRWVGNYLYKKKDGEMNYSHPPLLYKIKEENAGWKAHYFNQEIYGWFSDRNIAFSPQEQVWRRLNDGKIMFKQEVPHGEEVVQIGYDLWVIGHDKHTIHSFTTGRHFTFPYEEGVHALYDIPMKNPLILAGDKQTFYEVPLERVISFEKVKNVLEGNDARRFDIIVEESV